MKLPYISEESRLRMLASKCRREVEHRFYLWEMKQREKNRMPYLSLEDVYKYMVR